MIDMSKTYKTRDGREVRIYATDHGGLYPVVGAFFEDGRWQFATWALDGAFCGSKCMADLIEVKPRIERKVWLAVYDNAATLYQFRPSHLGSSCLAVVEVNIDCEHGEGLNND